MMNLRDKETMDTTKMEGDASSSSRWSSGHKNPRIVRVSRTFGGKDRHSKVCTIKGLRDRRIRLSVPTAIQLYDLQDRLDLSQPSKVIDWLLNTTKDDIDELPPLPPIPGSFPPYQQEYGMQLSSSDPFINANLGININSSLNVDVNEIDEDPSIMAKLRYWNSKQRKVIEDDHQDAIGNNQVLAQNLFPIANNHPMYNYCNQYWEPSNISSTQLGSLQHHHQENLTNSSSSLPSPLALSSRSQLFMSPSIGSTSSLLPPPHSSYAQLQVENDTRQFNRITLSNNPSPSSPYSSTGLGLKPFPLSMSYQPHHLHQSDDYGQEKDDNHPWKESSRN
ncbi:uncharacterized protein LOC141652762 [Silene latifolia]|uniref:uncharacterized protein LOC141652762 n=1 Tax=Silene latifolia TaxID=37657 RepID=UPI003D775BA2